ncbi:MAG: transketolase family protein [Firmicutes bacterium]|nr:transketolase family protein [Bacillota bacterium]
MKESLRQRFGKALRDLGRKNQDIYVLTADLSGSTCASFFGDEFPERFLNVGIAEQNMVGIAAGMASCGKYPYVHTFGVFAIQRAFDQICSSVAYSNLPVRIVCTHTGLSTGLDGATHQSISDIAAMRAVPNMTIISPADALEAELALKALERHPGPVYFRLTREERERILPEDYSFELGRAVQLADGDDAAVLATGIMVPRALAASRLLKEHGFNVRVINFSSLKPFDTDMVLQAARETKLLVTAEDHSIYGGLGAAVAETVTEAGLATPIVRLGVPDVFGESATGDELLDKYGLGVEDLVQSVLRKIAD